MFVDQLATGSHSYQGQDLFVLEILRAMWGGYFLDSGATNGVKGSNTWLLETYFGWTGICIEPNDGMFRELVQNRRCLCLPCCLYDREEPVEFLEDAGVYGGILQEYDPAHLTFAKQTLLARTGQASASFTVETVQKQARTLRSVLREAGAPAIIDYWSLDTEGAELAILKSFPFDEYRFRVLTVEHNEMPVREEIREFLECKGYTRVRVLGIDDGYVWNGDLPSHAWQSAAWSKSKRYRT